MKNLIFILAFLLFSLSIALAGTNNEIVWQKQVTDQVNDVKFSPDGLSIFSAMAFIEQRRASDGELINTFNDNVNQGIKCFDLSKDGKYLATCRATESIFRIWNLETGEIFKTYSDPSVTGASNYYLSFSPDGSKIAVVGIFNSANVIYVYDVQTGDILFKKAEPMSSDTSRYWCSVVYAPNGAYFAASCSAPYTGVTVFDAVNDTVICEFRNTAKDFNNTIPISISNDSKYIAFSYYGTSKIYDIFNKNLFKDYPNIGSGIIKFSESINLFVLSGRDIYTKFITKLFSFPQGTELYNYTHVFFPDWSPDNFHLAGYFVSSGPAYDNMALFNADLSILDVGEPQKISELWITNIYPNPTDNILSIDYLTTSIQTIEISLSDLNGNVIYRSLKSNGDRIAIDISTFSSGTYTITLTQGNLINERQVLINK